jgi:hypothetical protein
MIRISGDMSTQSRASQKTLCDLRASESLFPRTNTTPHALVRTPTSSPHLSTSPNWPPCSPDELHTVTVRNWRFGYPETCPPKAWHQEKNSAISAPLRGPSSSHQHNPPCPRAHPRKFTSSIDQPQLASLLCENHSDTISNFLFSILSTTSRQPPPPALPPHATLKPEKVTSLLQIIPRRSLPCLALFSTNLALAPK